MKAKVPGVVVAVAVLNFVFGGLGLLGFFCGGGALLWMASASPFGGDPVSQALALTWQALRQVPGYVPVAIGQLVVGLVLAVLVIVAGVGLLHLRGWARVLTLVYAVFTILLQIGGVVYTLAVVNPALDRVLPPMLHRDGAFGPGSNNLLPIVGALLSVGHGVFVLIALLLPSTAAAFRDPYGRYREDDYYDDEDEPRYDRRRRDDDWED